MYDWCNEWKMWFVWIFISPRGLTLQKIIPPEPNMSLTCYTLNFNTKCSCITGVMRENCALFKIFRVQALQGDNLPKYHLPETMHKVTWPVSYDIISISQISTPNVWLQQWVETLDTLKISTSNGHNSVKKYSSKTQ